jgi:hypothetical protein
VVQSFATVHRIRMLLASSVFQTIIVKVQAQSTYKN